MSKALQWVPEPSFAVLKNVLNELGGSWIPAFAGAAVLAAGAAAVIVRRRAEESLPFSPRFSSFAVVWLLAPGVILFIVSFVQPVLVPRYVITSVIALCLALAASLALFGRRVLVVGSAMLAFAFAAESWQDNVERSKEDWPGVASYLTANVAPGERIVVVTDFFSVNGLFYYEPSFGVDLDRLLFVTADENRLPKDVFVGYANLAPSTAWATETGSSFWFVSRGFRTPTEQAQIAGVETACATEEIPGFRLMQVVHVTSCR